MNLNNLKTTIFGIIAAAAAFFVANPDVISGEHAKLVQSISGFIMAGGLAGLGITAKDGSKGGNATNEVVDAKIPPETPASSIPPVRP